VSRDLCIAILPFALPGARQRAEAGDMARGIATIIESRLRLVREAKVFVQHLLFAPEGDPSKKGFLVRTAMWSVDEALEIPRPDGVEPTHLLHGSMTWDDEIRLTVELIDTRAAFACWREEIVAPPASFVVAFHDLLGRIAEATGAALTPQARQAIERRPTSNFDAFLHYATGVSATIALQLPLARPAAGRPPFHHFLQAMRADPMFSEPLMAINLLARGWFQDPARDPAIAVWALRESCNLAPGFIPLRGTLGRRLFHEGQFEEARVLLEDYVRLHPETEDDTASAVVCLAAIYRIENGPEQATVFLRQASRRFPANPDIQEALGVALLESGEPEEAEQCWRRVLDEHPRRPVALTSLGGALLARGDRARARILLERAVEVPEAGESTWTRLIDFLVDEGDIAAADQHATQWAEHRPEEWRPWLKLALVRQLAGDGAAAAYALAKCDSLKGARDSEGDTDPVRFQIPHADDWKSYVSAVATVGTPERRDPASHPPHVRTLAALAQRHRPFAFLWSALAEKYVQAGYVEQAIAAQQQACRLIPRSAAAHNTLGCLLVEAGRRPDSVLRFREAVRIAPGNRDYRVNLSSALLEESRLLEAEKHIDWLKRNAPSCAALPDLGRRLRDRRDAEQRAAAAPDDDPTPRGGILRRLFGLLRRDPDA